MTFNLSSSILLFRLTLGLIFFSFCYGFCYIHVVVKRFYSCFLINKAPKYKTDKLINKQGNNPETKPLGKPNFDNNKKK